MSAQTAFSAAADAYVAQAYSNTTRGSKTYLKAGDTNGNLRVAYLKFAVPTTTRSAVTSASLTLTANGTHSDGTVGVHVVSPTASWAESSLTFSNAPSYGALVTQKAIASSASTVSLDLTQQVVSGADIDLAITFASNRSVLQFYSREAGANGPQLRLTLADSTSTQGPAPAPSTSAAPTKAPSTSTPTSAPSSTSSSSTGGTFSRPTCSVSAQLVPSCGRWLGIASMAHTNIPVTEGLPEDESLAGRPFDIVHFYHRNGELFPTATERQIAYTPGANKLLLINWKPATDMSWAAVAAGRADSRIDQEASYLKSTFTNPFFLAIWHEPENDVNNTAGSGKTAADYAAMYRHVVLRLRADGVHNAITVMNYMGFIGWATDSWFSQLWPGDDVVDWIGIDPYACGTTNPYCARTLSTLVNRTNSGWSGYYNYMTAHHPGKPIMLAEWGVEYVSSNPTAQANFFTNVGQSIGNYPMLKALVYFDMPQPSSGSPDTYPGRTTGGLAAYRWMNCQPGLVAPEWSYQ